MRPLRDSPIATSLTASPATNNLLEIHQIKQTFGREKAVPISIHEINTGIPTLKHIDKYKRSAYPVRASEAHQFSRL